MNKITSLLICTLLTSIGFCQTASYTLDDYVSNNTQLNQKVEDVFDQLSDEQKVAQLIMPAIGRLGQTEETIFKLVKEQKIGGLLMLNGTKEQFKTWIDSIESLNSKSGALPFLYSADAEPTLVNRKIIGSEVVKKANEIQTLADVNQVATTISTDLNKIGINYNFAPVVDLSTNKTVGYRGFGANPANIIPWCSAFIEISQNQNIIATAKHFPGHGLVSGDTHKSLQVIDGELKELSYYPPLIESGVLSIMVGHLAIRNNPQFQTNGLPATISKTIVTNLLRDSLNFEGLIVTDAMNMGGVVNFPNADLAAIEAGCDILLMPLDAEKAYASILDKYQKDEEFKKQLNASVKRIIRMKICLGLLEQ